MKPLVCLVGMLTAAAANAGVTYGESPRNFMLEVKLGPYIPLIDRSFPVDKGPFKATFGGTPLILGEVELDFQVFQKFGSAAIGISGGYTEKFGKSQDAMSGKVSTASTGLRLVPIKLLAIYRFDYYAIHKRIPLVPYLKAGFVGMPWWVTNGGEVEVAEGDRGAGVKFGAVGVFGLSVLLDVLDDRLSRDFDNSMGVNHSYLFAEFALQEVNNFKPVTAGQLDFSSQHFMFGLGFEF